MGESTFVEHESCPGCGSSDALARYDDGHAYCFSCGRHELGAGATKQERPPEDLIEGDVRPLTKRGISAETCRRFRYLIGKDKGETVHVATYCDARGVPVAQKLRTQAKDFYWKGEPKRAGLFGQHLWRGHGRRIVVTEGEIDALSYAEAVDCKWAVVSVANGAQGAPKAVKAQLEFLEGYDEVVFAFDMDEPGQAAAAECAELLAPGKARIACMPRKDANEMLLELGPGVLSKLPFEARPYRPDDILNASDLWDLVSTPPEHTAIDYPWPELTSMTRGLRRGEIVTLCAGSGIGKSTVCRELEHHLLRQGETIGVVALEEALRQTLLGILSIQLNRPLHLPETEQPDRELLRAAFDATLGTGRMALYDHWGSIESARLMAKLRSLARVEGAGWIVLDHISIVVSGLETANERKDLDVAMTTLRTLAEEMNLGIIVVSHLKRVTGRAFERGGEVQLSDLRGSAALEQLSDIVIGLERDQQDEDEADRMKVRVLKNRFSGDTGLCGALDYDKATGRLLPGGVTEFDNEESNEACDFA